MKLLVISSSLNPKSRSAIMARYAQDLLLQGGYETTFIDLTEWELPFCDGDTCYSHKNATALSQKVEEATGLLVSTPIYNFAVSSSVKNFVELTGRGWNEKVVGFICAAGGQSSYMAVMPFANSLMLDYRCLIIPHFVYATETSFKNGKLVSSKIKKRIAELTESLASISRYAG